MRRVHIVIKGQVQGVFFRTNLKELASQLNITGWTRNINHEVEALLEGDDDSIADILIFCTKGTKNAKVKSIDLDEEPYIGEFDEFSIID